MQQDINNVFYNDDRLDMMIDDMDDQLLMDGDDMMMEHEKEDQIAIVQ